MAPTAAMAFLSVGPSGGEMLVVFVVALLLFGPRRLPEIARAIGKALELLRRSSQDFKDQVMNIDREPPGPVPPAAEPPPPGPGGDDGLPKAPCAGPAVPDAGRPGKDSEDDYTG